ncbi:transcription intermediary factor 1-beta-like [Mytilus californianus]|uniref:transcription intermediary factor 1-beta-like n=1 Tax=Mytilus californianus TaxID=6549 RepID=UPI0022480866|nr:transcription intermediary factor 1-beta-like [Mytilus californianus]
MASSKPVSCGHCQREEVNTVADIWCTNCDEGLCSTCSGLHVRFKPTGDHKTIDIKRFKPHIGSIKTECDKHNQQFNFYCPIHLMPCCDKCISNHHSECTGIKRLASAVQEANIEQSKQSVDKEISSILLLLNKMANEKLRNIINGEQQHKNIKESISKIREGINKHLDRLEAELYKEAATVWSEEKSNLTCSITEIEEKKKNLKEIQDDVHTVTEHNSKLQSFLGMHQIEKKIHQCRYAVDIENDEVASEIDIKLKQNDEMEKVLSEFQSLKSLGEVKVVKSKMTISRETSASREPQVALRGHFTTIQNMLMNIETQIYLKMQKIINDMVCLMDGRVIVVEWNGKVNLLTSDGQFQKQVPISGGAFCVTQINQGTIAITYPKEKTIKIYHMETENVTKVIQLDKGCYGLSSSNNFLVVGLSLGEIRIINLEGNTLKSIQRQNELVVTNIVYCDDRVIYSDYGGTAVYCVDRSGQQIWKFKEDLCGPKGLCVDIFGNIILADYGSNSRIIVISKDGKNSKILLREHNGLKDMKCICNKNNEHYGLMCDNRGIKLAKFNLSYE